MNSPSILNTETLNLWGPGPAVQIFAFWKHWVITFNVLVLIQEAFWSWFIYWSCQNPALNNNEGDWTPPDWARQSQLLKVAVVWLVRLGGEDGLWFLTAGRRWPLGEEAVTSEVVGHLLLTRSAGKLASLARIQKLKFHLNFHPKSAHCLEICRWTLRLFPPFGSCEQHRSEHWCSSFCLRSCFSILGVVCSVFHTELVLLISLLILFDQALHQIAGFFISLTRPLCVLLCLAHFP